MADYSDSDRKRHHMDDAHPSERTKRLAVDDTTSNRSSIITHPTSNGNQAQNDEDMYSHDASSGVSSTAFTHQNNSFKNQISPSHSMDDSTNQYSSTSELPAISIRCLLTAKETGSVIGKHGSCINHIRSQVENCKIHISEQIPGCPDRILSVTGSIGHVAMVYSLVATALIKESCSNGDDQANMCSRPSEGVLQTTAITLKLIVPQSRIGMLIGKQGIKLKYIQQESCARMMVENDFLPFSTEKMVRITGVVDAIHIAMFHIALVLAENKTKEMGKYIPFIPRPMMALHDSGKLRGAMIMMYPSRPVTPGASHPSASGGSNDSSSNIPANPSQPHAIFPYSPHPAFLYQTPPMGYQYLPMIPVYDPSAHVSTSGRYSKPGMHAILTPISGSPSPTHTPNVQGSALRQQDSQRHSLNMEIPLSSAGHIIGPKGMSISEIRQVSQCQIRMHPPVEGQGYRVLSIFGEMEQVKVAERRVLDMLATESH